MGIHLSSLALLITIFATVSYSSEQKTYEKSLDLIKNTNILNVCPHYAKKYSAGTPRYETNKSAKNIVNILLSFRSPKCFQKSVYPASINIGNKKTQCCATYTSSYQLNVDASECNILNKDSSSLFGIPKKSFFNKALRWDLPHRNKIHSVDIHEMSTKLKLKSLPLHMRLQVIGTINCRFCDCSELKTYSATDGFIARCRRTLEFDSLSDSGSDQYNIDISDIN